MPPDTVGRPALPVNWIAGAALAGAFASWLITVAVGAGGAHKTLNTVEASVAYVSAELKTELKEMAKQRTAVAEAITALVVEVREVRKENREIVIALAGLGASQNEQGILVITLQVEAGAAKEDRLRMQQAATEMGWDLKNNSKYLHTLKEQMSALWGEKGFPPINEDKGDG